MSVAAPFRRLLPLDESLSQEALYVTFAGCERIKPGEPYPSKEMPPFYLEWNKGRALPEFSLMLAAAGRGEIQTRNHRVCVQTGDAVLFAPGEWHRHRPSPKTGWTLMWVHFNGGEPHRWLRDKAFNLRRNIAVIENGALFQAEFARFLESVHREPSRNPTNLSLQVMGLLSHFVRNTSLGAVRGATKVQDERVSTAVEYIWNFSRHVIDVPAVARHAGIARRTLDARFKAATGHSVLDEIQFCRVFRAAKLLEETDMPIKLIVQQAGFRSREHFRLVFQKTYGQAPRAYRKKARSDPSSEPRPSSPSAALVQNGVRGSQ